MGGGGCNMLIELKKFADAFLNETWKQLDYATPRSTSVRMFSCVHAKPLSIQPSFL